MRYLYNGESKYRGTCRPLWPNKDSCKNQFYWLVISRAKFIDGRIKVRKVLSFGFIFRGYGRVFDIPFTSWFNEIP